LHLAVLYGGGWLVMPAVGGVCVFVFSGTSILPRIVLIGVAYMATAASISSKRQ